MIVRWIALALILGVSGPVHAFTDSFRLYIYNYDFHNYYHVRIKNEDSGWNDAKNVEAGSCQYFTRIEPGRYSVRIYKDGSMLSDHVWFDVSDEKCIRIRSETGHMESCNEYSCP